MSNLYVGFRYVPLFCGVWSDSKGYEALSVVTHNGGGYTSNKPVPAGVEPGTDSGEYWAYTYRAGGEASEIDWDNIQNKPSSYPTTWEQVAEKPDAFPANWEDINGKPTTFPSNWDDITGKPTIFPTNWDSIENKPTTFPPSTHTHTIKEIDTLEEELESINDDLNSINSTLNQYDGEFSAFEEELTSIKTSLSSLSTNYSTLNTKVTEIQTDVSTLETTIEGKADANLQNVSNEDFSAKAAAAGVGGGGGASTWDEITGKPDTFPTTWNEVADKPTSFPTAWGDITGKPENYPTNWASISDKPATFPPSSHTHTISNITGLSTDLEEMTNDISSLTASLQTVNSEIDTMQSSISSLNSNYTSLSNTVQSMQSTMSGFMDAPSNTGGTNYYLGYSSRTQGYWRTLPAASATSAGTMSSSMYTKVNNIYRYITNMGTYGNFYFRYWSDGFVECWTKIEISNLAVSTALGNMYRSGSPIGQTEIRYPYTFSTQPYVTGLFFTSNNASALLWPNPSWQNATQYLCPFYLVRPTSGTCSGYVYFYICGDT